MAKGTSVPVHPTYARIYRLVDRIPRGRVATYGQIAAFADLPGRARQVGYALAALPNGSPLPWHRVINARGEVSLDGRCAEEQRARLEAEGVTFNDAGRVSLARFSWAGPRRRAKAAPKARRRN